MFDAACAAGEILRGVFLMSEVPLYPDRGGLFLMSETPLYADLKRIFDAACAAGEILCSQQLHEYGMRHGYTCIRHNVLIKWF